MTSWQLAALTTGCAPDRRHALTRDDGLGCRFPPDHHATRRCCLAQVSDCPALPVIAEAVARRADAEGLLPWRAGPPDLGAGTA